MTALAGTGAVRHPVRRDVDGDFTLEELVALSTDGTVRRSASAREAVTARPGGLRMLRTPTREDEALLRAIETSAAVRPPVHQHLDELTPTVARAWLAHAAHCIDLSHSSGDLRFLNTACKLIGAVWLHHRLQRDDRVAPAKACSQTLIGQLGAIGRLLDRATMQLTEALSHRLALPELQITQRRWSSPDQFTGPSLARIVVLAGAGSHSAGRVVAAASASGLPVVAVCWYEPRSGEKTVSTNYGSAWYPPGRPSDTPPPATVSTTIRTTTATSWDRVAAAIRAADADLVLLVGMPIVPADVLECARLGVLNAHNGALPGYRGMDAVGWALLHNQPIVCTLHMARPVVDAGEVLAVQPVSITPLPTLGARVKATQLRLLLAGAMHVATAGALPDLTPQRVTGTQFYRLHPHLKRVLDTSPYATLRTDGAAPWIGY